VQLAGLVETSHRIAATRSRRDKVGRLAELLRRLEPDEVVPAVSHLTGRLPQGRIGLGPSAVRRARSDTAEATSGLGVSEVDRCFERMAGLAGPGSGRERGRLLRELLARATPDEQDFLVRLVLGELRQGALAGLMAEAVARAAGLPAPDVRRALMLAGDLPAVARAALVEGAAGLARFRIQPFRPLQPMLARPADDLASALQRTRQAALEVKLDGARVQVHRSGDEIRIFSRRLNDVTGALPEVVEAVRSAHARELVVDGEVLALHPDGAPHPFQTTMRRFGRRLDVERLQRQLPLTPFFFDLLQRDGEALIDRPAAERFALLDEVLPGLGVPRRRVRDAVEAEAFLRETLERGHEGVMVKDLEAPYEAGARGAAWLKVKPAHTLDLVVLAVEEGSGRRRGWLSNLHLGARDPRSGELVMVGKTFKGLTDAMLRWQTRRLRELAVRQEDFVLHVRPELVVEVAVSGVQQSPHYPAGLALRFARVKAHRPDKAPTEADTIEALRALRVDASG